MLSRINDLFNIIMQLRSGLGQLHKQIHFLNEIGLNATVTLGHATSHGRVFSEISLQLNKGIKRLYSPWKAQSGYS